MTPPLSSTALRLILLALFVVQGPALAAPPEQESRRQQLLDVLLSQEMKNHLTNFETKHNERYRWEYYTACLAKGVHVDQANHYLATHQDIGNALPESCLSSLPIDDEEGLAQTVVHPVVGDPSQA